MTPAHHCRHPAGWTHSHGVSRCERCGTRRFTEYGALRPPGLPQATAPGPAPRADWQLIGTPRAHIGVMHSMG
ncbi:DUF6255 family natural product biosynthesis protein [Streptomyces cinnamoneus]|uniref:DUF6255 family natural product biosynthesis protein n=1 Tax=Streptomyces cinnamoneus TaxID=53446 RepID=UPI003B9696C8